MRYEAIITATYEKFMEIDAKDKTQAHDKVYQMYADGEIDVDDLVDAEVTIYDVGNSPYSE